MSKSIIVIDPEPAGKSVIKSSLEWDGFNVVVLSHPKAAVEVMKILRPVLIVTNVLFSGMTGHEAMRMFQDSRPYVPVLMVSELRDSDVIQHWRSQKGFDVFFMPSTAQALKVKVKEMLTRPKSHSATG